MGFMSKWAPGAVYTFHFLQTEFYGKLKYNNLPRNLTDFSKNFPI